MAAAGAGRGGLGLPESAEGAAGGAGPGRDRAGRGGALRGWLAEPVPGVVRGHVLAAAAAAVVAGALLRGGAGGGGARGGASAPPLGSPGGFKPQILMFSSSLGGSPAKAAEARRMRHILEARGVPYREVDVAGSRGAQSHLRATSGSLETPQLHAGGRLVGFFEEVQELEDAGALVRELVFLDDAPSPRRRDGPGRVA